MKKLLVIVLAMAMLFTISTSALATETMPEAVTNAANAYFADYPGSRIVAWEEVLALIEAGEEPFVLSIRQEADYAEGHVEGAYLAAWGVDLAEKVAMLPTDEKVYVYCYTGQTAGQTVALLNMLGIDAVSVKSGMAGLKAVEGYEDVLSTEAVELENAGAEFDPEVLAFVQGYFNAIPENGSNILPSDSVIALIESGDATVVDIRKADDYAAGHIDGAVNLPFGENMQEGFATLPEGKLIVTCYSGQTAGQTVAIMRALGFDVDSLKSGMNAWVEAELPIVVE